MDDHMSPDDLHKAKYQVYVETQQRELYQQAYPHCLQQCRTLSTQKNPSLIFEHKELSCAQNCIQKHKASLNLALGLITMGMEPEKQ
jgi:hypothetical protein